MGKTTDDARLVINNASIYQFYRSQFINLALSQFEYDGMPKSLDLRYMEWVLLSQGSCAVYQVAGTDIWLCTGWRIDGSRGYTPYGQPRHIVGIDAMGRQHQVEPGKFFICYDSNMYGVLNAGGGASGIPGYGASAGLVAGAGGSGVLLSKIEHQSSLLYETHMVLRHNLQQQIRPYIVRTTRNEQLSIENLFKKLLNFAPVIEVKNSMDLKNMVDTIDLRVPYIGGDLLDTRRELWKDGLAMLGITAETTKKERLIADEVSANRQEDVIALNSRLQNRKRLCEWLNEQGFADASVNVTQPQGDTLSLPQLADPGSTTATTDTGEDQEEDSNG